MLFFVGKYPLTLSGLLSGDAMQWRVFLTLRASRAVIGAIGGFVLGVTGFVYQTVFRNPLASPDIIGASSGASVGAAFGILFCPARWLSPYLPLPEPSVVYSLH